MKKDHVILALVALVLLFITILLLPVTRDELSWRLARSRDTSESYTRYLAKRPAGRHAVAANTQVDDLAWEKAQASKSLNGFWRYASTFTNGAHLAAAQLQIQEFLWEQAVNANTMAGFEGFLKNYPTNSHAPDARARIEAGNWQQAKSGKSLRLLRAYLASYPQGRHVAEARQLETALRTDDQPLQTALNLQTEKGLQDFLNDFPGHAQEPAARQALKDLTEGREIFDLIADKKIEAFAIGTETEVMLIRLKKITPGAVTVRVPVGTWFASDFASVPHMVGRTERRMRLQTDLWTELDVPAVSVNHTKDHPSSGETFKLKRLPAQSPLLALVPLLQKANATYPVWQAAVWIALANASYDDMGALTTHPNGFLLENVRLINEPEAAQAMQLCEASGINLFQKKILKKNRADILRGLKDPELKKWLESKVEVKP